MLIKVKAILQKYSVIIYYHLLQVVPLHQQSTNLLNYISSQYNPICELNVCVCVCVWCVCVCGVCVCGVCVCVCGVGV